MHSKKIFFKFMVKKRYLWLPEFYSKKYGNNILGFTLNLQLNTVISLTDIMLIYQPAEVLQSVLYLCISKYLCTSLKTIQCRR